MPREPGPTTDGARPSTWTGRDALLFLAVFVVALLVRLVYSSQIEDFPLFEHPTFDGRRYVAWAKEIAGGEWLGTEVFFQAPLYPYFLALLFLVLGEDLGRVHLVQFVLGAAACGLVALAGRSFFSRAVGLVAGLLLALYPPSLFYEGLIQKTVLDLFSLALFLALLGAASRAPRAVYWIGMGVALGLLALTRENALAWVPLVPLWIWIDFASRERTVRLRWTALFLAGWLGALLPVALRNHHVGGELALTTSQFGANFYVGNNPRADGTYEPLGAGWGNPELELRDYKGLAEKAAGRALSPREVSRYWLGESLAYMRAQPGDWLALVARKWLLVWNAREIEDADDYYLLREHSSLLRSLASVLHFGTLVPLAAFGIVLARMRWRELWILLALLLVLAASVAAFFVFGRYRFPMVPVLALFAAAGAVEGVAAFRSRAWRSLAPAAAALVLAALVVNWPLIRTRVPSAAGYNNLANALREEGRPAEARSAYERALELHPASEMIHYNLGVLLADQGELGPAAQELERAIALDPGFAEAHNNLGIVLGRRGDRAGALARFRAAVELRPDLVEARMNLGTALLRQGDLAGAQAEFERSLLLEPDLAAAREALQRVQATRAGESVERP